MRDRIFIDSNIWLYLFDVEASKKSKALSLLKDNHFISTQVLSENANVCLRKFKMDIEDVRHHVENLSHQSQVLEITQKIIFQAFSIHKDYQYSYYDSLIISAALEHDCNILYSEDLQSRQMIYGKLKIENPFLSS